MEIRDKNQNEMFNSSMDKSPQRKIFEEFYLKDYSQTIIKTSVLDLSVEESSKRGEEFSFAEDYHKIKTQYKLARKGISAYAVGQHPRSTGKEVGAQYLSRNNLRIHNALQSMREEHQFHQGSFVEEDNFVSLNSSMDRVRQVKQKKLILREEEEKKGSGVGWGGESGGVRESDGAGRRYGDWEREGSALQNKSICIEDLSCSFKKAEQKNFNQQFPSLAQNDFQQLIGQRPDQESQRTLQSIRSFKQQTESNEGRNSHLHKHSSQFSSHHHHQNQSIRSRNQPSLPSSQRTAKNSMKSLSSKYFKVIDDEPPLDPLGQQNDDGEEEPAVISKKEAWMKSLKQKLSTVVVGGGTTLKTSSCRSSQPLEGGSSSHASGQFRNIDEESLEVRWRGGAEKGGNSFFDTQKGEEEEEAGGSMGKSSQGQQTYQFRNIFRMKKQL